MAHTFKLYANSSLKSLVNYTKPFIFLNSNCTKNYCFPIFKPNHRSIITLINNETNFSLTCFSSKFPIKKYSPCLSANVLLSHAGINSRLFSSQNEDPATKKENPMLMNFPLIIWPSFIQTLRNWIFVFVIIKPYYESDFTLQSFCTASKQALVKVSQLLSEGNFQYLGEFVEKKALEEVQSNYSILNLKQRTDLTVTLEDIFFCFPYQIGVIFNKDAASETDRVYLEIMMCFHVFKGFKDFVESSNDTDLRAVYDQSDRISIANYRFIKEVTKGADDQWTINVLNHFKPVKLVTKF